MWKTTAEGPYLPVLPAVVAEVTDSFDSSFFAARMVRLSVSASSPVGFGFLLVSHVMGGVGEGKERGERRGQRAGQGRDTPRRR